MRDEKTKIKNGKSSFLLSISPFSVSKCSHDPILCMEIAHDVLKREICAAPDNIQGEHYSDVSKISK